MRLTQKLYAQHIGFMFKKHWQVQGKRVPRTTGAIEELAKYGITVQDPSDFVKPKFPKVELEIFKKIPIDTSSYVECYNFGNNNVLVEGLQQAQIISKSIVVNELPEKVADAIKSTQISSNTNKNLHRAILTSFTFDAYQEKLPKVKVPEKPMYNLPRIYGIPANRKCELLISKLLFECEKLASSDKTSQNKIVNNTHFDIFVKKADHLINLNIKADTLLLNKKPIQIVKGRFEGTVPDIFPLDFTIGLNQWRMPKNELQLFNGIISSYWPQIIFSHFIPEDVTNLYGTPVTTNQFEGRTLLKAFTVAYSKAKNLYGDKNQDLEKPIVVQAIQTDGKRFHFGIFQLNTMNLGGTSETTNIWFQTPILELFDVCEYLKGKPTLNGFNSEVFKVLNVFYNHS